MKERPEFPVKLFWANQGKGGVHVNISGAGVVTTLAQAGGARRSSSSGCRPARRRRISRPSTWNIPVNAAVAVDPLVKSWGAFEASKVNIAEAGRLQPAAVKLMDRAGYR